MRRNVNHLLLWRFREIKNRQQHIPMAPLHKTLTLHKKRMLRVFSHANKSASHLTTKYTVKQQIISHHNSTSNNPGIAPFATKHIVQTSAKTSPHMNCKHIQLKSQKSAFDVSDRAIAQPAVLNASDATTANRSVPQRFAKIDSRLQL